MIVEPPTSVYIHVPFCRSRCSYCDFYANVCPASTWRRWFKGVSAELELLKTVPTTRPLKTIYFGGGTPSLVDPVYIAELIATFEQIFTFSPDIEISLEANPESVDRERAVAWHKAGVNRVSLGLQSATPQILTLLARAHTVEQFSDAVASLSDAGIKNIAADLMFGIKGQTLSMVDDALDLLAELAILHVSFYALSLEPGTPLFERFKDEEITDEEARLERAMYWRIRERLETRGLEVYEIANAAKPGLWSRHNLVYWQARPYFGLGPGAASFFGGERRQNVSDLDAWLLSIERAKRERFYTPSTLVETIDRKESMKETMLLGLRLSKGVDLDKFFQRFEIRAEAVFSTEIDALISEGLLTYDAEYVRLTPRGVDFANLAFQAFV